MKKKSKASKRQYVGALATALEPMGMGILATDEERSNAGLSRATTEATKLLLLLDAFRVDRGPDQWLDLCLALAREHVPGFKDAVRKGRSRKWDIGTLWLLSGEMRRELNAGANSDAEAARRLAAKDPWKAFMATGAWGKGKTRGATPSSALLEQHKKMPRRHRRIGEDAFKMHEHDGTVAEWLAHVADILLNPSIGK